MWVSTSSVPAPSMRRRASIRGAAAGVVTWSALTPALSQGERGQDRGAAGHGYSVAANWRRNFSHCAS